VSIKYRVNVDILQHKDVNINPVFYTHRTGRQKEEMLSSAALIYFSTGGRTDEDVNINSVF